MKTIISVLAISVLLVGCDGRFIKRDLPNTCGNTGWTLTTIHYGDSYLAVIPISEIVDGAEWRFVLDPQDDATYGNAIVKVRGKTAAESWFLEQQGTASADGSIKVCITGAGLSEGDIVFYDIEVDGVGKLDPRGRVIIRPGS